MSSQKNKQRFKKLSVKPAAVKPNNPRPVRFSSEDEAMLKQLTSLTGLTISSVIRRSVQYAVPCFLDGSVSLLTLKHNHPALPLIPRGKSKS